MSRLAAIFFCLVAATAAAQERAAWDALGEPGAIAALRHASAPGMPGDPAAFDLEKPATQRNLSAGGRAEARAIGAALKARGVRVDRVLTSRWHRCRETARLLIEALDPAIPVEDAPMLDNLWDNRENAAGQTAAFERWKAARDRSETVLLVSHGITVRTLIGPSLAEGEMLVLRQGADGGLREVGTIPPPAP